jgi:acyl-CoA thioester hydrolase
VRATFDPPADPAAYRFCHRLRVRFAETDAMAVVHHGAYLTYLECARVEFLRASGHPYPTLRQEGFELPVVEVTVRYLQPLHFDELVDIHLVATAAKGATFEIGYLVAVDGQPKALAVSVHAVTGAGGRPARCPAWLVELCH